MIFTDNKRKFNILNQKIKFMMSDDKWEDSIIYIDESTKETYGRTVSDMEEYLKSCIKYEKFTLDVYNKLKTNPLVSFCIKEGNDVEIRYFDESSNEIIGEIIIFDENGLKSKELSKWDFFGVNENGKIKYDLYIKHNISK